MIVSMIFRGVGYGMVTDGALALGGIRGLEIAVGVFVVLAGIEYAEKRRSK